MSLADPILDDPIPAHPPARPRTGGGPWAWATAACLLLGSSAAVRMYQERQHQFERSYKEACPFDLAKLPAQFGDWKLVSGGEKKLDPLTMRITGGTDHLIRTYANEMTGVSLTALILFGPADPVLPHVPAACYPASGFSEGERPVLRTIEYPLGKDAEGQPVVGRADFLASSYAKPAGRSVLHEAVYHSFRLDGRWSPYIGAGRKFPRRNPGVFKIQVQRVTAEQEVLGQGDPIEPFLADLVAGIEAEIKAASAPKAVASR